MSKYEVSASMTEKFRTANFSVSRPLGVAVGELFRGAVAAHQGSFYQVTSIDNKGMMLPIDKDTYEKIKHKLHLFDPSFINLMADFPVREDYESEEEYFEEKQRRIRIQIPHSVQCYITDPIGMFWCSDRNCNEFLSLRSQRLNSSRKCPRCNAEMFQAPVLVLRQESNERNALRSQREPIIKISNRPCSDKRHGTKTTYRQLASLKPTAPFQALRLYCRDHETPDAPSAEKVFRKDYHPQLPSQRLIMPVMATVCRTKKGERFNYDPLSETFIDSANFYPALEVVQVVLGYSYQDSSVTRPLDVYNGRKFITQGIEIKLKEGSYPALSQHLEQVYKDPVLFEDFCLDVDALSSLVQESETEQYKHEQLRRWVLHSLCHALSVMLPYQTGLEANKFGYSYDVVENRVFIYDNEEGGIGGSEMLFRDRSAWLSYVEVTKERLANCDCRARCPRCIVTNSCGEVSNALNRHLLGPIFNIETNYE